MSGNKSLAERAIHLVFSEASLQAFWTYAFPPLFALATAAAGIVEKQPIMWVMAASAISFAMIAVGLLAFYQWRFRRTPEHKVIFMRIMVNRSPTDVGTTVVFGFVMKSTADFPLEVTLTKLNYSLANRIPTKPLSLNNRTLRVDAYSEFYFTGNAIDISGITEEDLSGEIEFGFDYGRPGGNKFKVSKTQVLAIPLDMKKPFVHSEKLLADEQVGQSA